MRRVSKHLTHFALPRGAQRRYLILLLLSTDKFVFYFLKQVVLLCVHFLDLVLHLRESECCALRVGRKHRFTPVNLRKDIKQARFDLLFLE